VSAEPIVRIVELERPVEEVWDLWADPARVAEWLVPRLRVDLRAGGSFEPVWEGDDAGTRPAGGSRILSLEEEYQVRFEWRGPPQFAELLNRDRPATTVSARFQPLGPGRTRLRLEHTGWGDGEAWAAARSWHDEMWGTALERLRQLSPKR